ncbi:pyrimidine reductase family protein [Pseudonocardia acaciae]|uniref:pyrimidine reductase family protein n=1 Tax=Pseudonocardia acaciae TaxID=551276 RepID=UPI00048BB321|nr:pyrimidine reductase family protein [Pseudonocardia acaciae]
MRLSELSEANLARAYAYPDGLERPYVRVNFVTSVDGAATVRGLSRGLSSKPDRRVFGLLRRLCDVILVGAQTARAENYRGARKPNQATGAPPRIAVVTASAELDPAAPLFTDTAVPPLILAASGAPPANLRRLADAGAEVVELGEHPLTPAALLAELDARGLRRVLCEGGPRLFGELVAAGAVDELCLTITPALVGAGTARMVGSALDAPRGLRLAGVLEEDGVLLLRYLREG